MTTTNLFFNYPNHSISDDYQEKTPTKRKLSEIQTNEQDDHVPMKQIIGKQSKQETTPQKSDEANFFLQVEPKIWYPLHRTEEGKIKVDLFSAKTVKKVIYVFRNREKNRLLIGKTGGNLARRIANYMTKFNQEGSEEKVKKEGRKAFLSDVKKHPEHFDVGVLHALTAEEDLDFFETGFIQHKRVLYALYNENGGGGGGCAHSEEKSTIYAIPKPGTPFTPVKYYRFHKNAQGDIRPQFSPGFKNKVSELKQDMEDTQGFLYAIKELSVEEEKQANKRYIGVTGREDPSIRAKEHGYSAEYCDPEHKKYDPSCSTGYLHPALAQAPEKYGFGLLPLRSVENIPADQRENYVLLNGVAKVESYVIKAKQSHISQNGLNGNYGGGGPIAKRATGMEDIKKKLSFES